jgi:hypothetical protein
MLMVLGTIGGINFAFGLSLPITVTSVGISTLLAAVWIISYGTRRK